MKKNKAKKRAIALLLTVIMMLGLSGVVLAANPTWPAEWDSATSTGSLEIIKTAEDGTTTLSGAEYTLYRIAVIDVSTSTAQMSYTSLISGLTINTGTRAADITPEMLATLPSTEEYNTGINSSGSGTVTNDDGKVTFSNLPFGVYLVKEIKVPAGVTVSHDFLISVPMTVTDSTGNQTWQKDNLKATPKNSVFSGSIKKTVDTTSAETNIVVDADGNNTVDIGADINYKIEVNTPADFFGTGTNAKTYTQFDIFDDADTALTVDTTSIQVAINGTAVKEVGAAGTDPVGYKLNDSTTGEFTINLVKEDTSTSPSTFTPYYNGLAAGSKVVITYTAFVNTSAMPGVAISNDVKIKYQYTGGTPGEKDPDTEPEPDVYTYSHAILKVGDSDVALGHDDAAAANIKAGAKFVARNAAGKYLYYNKSTNAASAADDYWEWVTLQDNATVFQSGFAAPLATMSKDGYIELIGLAAGTYTLTEIEAPDGYSLLKTPVSIDIDKNSTDIQKIGNFTTKIINVTGFTLPGTGGAGIYIFIIGGVVLIGAALILYGKTRRKRKNI